MQRCVFFPAALVWYPLHTTDVHITDPAPRALLFSLELFSKIKIGLLNANFCPAVIVVSP